MSQEPRMNWNELQDGLEWLKTEFSKASSVEEVDKLIDMLTDGLEILRSRKLELTKASESTSIVPQLKPVNWTVNQLIELADHIEEVGRLIKDHPWPTGILRVTLGDMAKYEQRLDDAIRSQLSMSSFRSTGLPWPVSQSALDVANAWACLFEYDATSLANEMIEAVKEYWRYMLDTMEQAQRWLGSDSLNTKTIHVGFWYSWWASVQAKCLRLKAEQLNGGPIAEPAEEPLLAIFDKVDGLYRCPYCTWELDRIRMLDWPLDTEPVSIVPECAHCGREYAIPEKLEDANEFDECKTDLDWYACEEPVKEKDEEDEEEEDEGSLVDFINDEEVRSVSGDKSGSESSTDEADMDAMEVDKLGETEDDDIDEEDGMDEDVGDEDENEYGLESDMADEELCECQECEECRELEENEPEKTGSETLSLGGRATPEL